MFGLKSLKLHFLPFLAGDKFITHSNIQIHDTGLIFILKTFFLKCSYKCPRSESITIEHSKKHENLACKNGMIPFKAGPQGALAHLSERFHCTGQGAAEDRASP